MAILMVSVAAGVLSWLLRPQPLPGTFDSYGDVTVFVDNPAIDTTVSLTVYNAAFNRQRPDACPGKGSSTDSSLGIQIYPTIDSKAKATVDAGHSISFRWALVLSGSMVVPDPARFVSQLSHTVPGATTTAGFLAMPPPDDKKMLGISTYGYRDVPKHQLGRQIFYGAMAITPETDSVINAAEQVCGTVSKSTSSAVAEALPSLGLSFDSGDDFSQLFTGVPDPAAVAQQKGNQWYQRLTTDSRLDLEPMPKGPFDVRYTTNPTTRAFGRGTEWDVQHIVNDEGRQVEGLDATSARLVWLDEEQAASQEVFYSGIAAGVAAGGLIALIQMAVEIFGGKRLQRKPAAPGHTPDH